MAFGAGREERDSMSARDRYMAQARAEHLLNSARLTRRYDQHVAADRFITLAKEVMATKRVADKKKLEEMLAELEGTTEATKQPAPSA